MSSRRTLLTRRLADFGRDERGVAALFYGLLMVALFGFAAFAVDTAYMHFKRTKLQNAADAAALAGASSLLAHGEDLALVRAEMIEYARANLDPTDAPLSAVAEADILFMRDGVPVAENPDQVEITVYRQATRGNALSLFFGPVVGVDQVDLQATARAGVVGACDSKCVKPFIVPAKFTWNDFASTDGKARGNGKLDVWSAEEMASVQTLGWSDEDKGAQILLKPGDPADAVVPSQYNLVDLPPVNKGVPVPGGAMLRENIRGCEGSNAETTVAPGDELQLEPGNTVGPVKQGIRELLNADPGAYWDAATLSVKGSVHTDPMSSERVVVVAFYDPRYPPVSGRTTQRVYQVGAVFIEAMDGKGTVTARFMEALARSPEDTGGSCGDPFLFLPRLMLDTDRGG
ncbi:Flp pilus assembly protein TadG [Paucidesulfovibrio gracilis DSM 16080]|uniref:Flp pilus assembly protein TadG n=1 Tax=Paucidesulfovibrio gracilis DSM 16080 TaxID=1121449 RepID=A0A1T4XN78_9BACT|nr:pilus assembly protein TadG-related protein [Paucidesulfovibrio gracilis]SKA90535.1 Flp pilus assembly protein TadG [Paucidesulfovibrio gracilis DSM 16080]